MHVLRGKPSPAMVVAICALAFAMVGTAVAGTDGLSSKITKSKVKSISKKQANKVLNGREASLNVKSAKTADSATNATNATNAQNATNATNVNSLVPFSYRSNATATQTTIFNQGGLILRASCPAGTSVIQADTSVADSYIDSRSIAAVNTSTAENALENEDFDPGELQNLVAGSQFQTIGNTSYATPTNRGVTLTWNGDDITFGFDCQFEGYAVVR